MNNTMNHISDQASTVVFDPTGTQWGAGTTDVQSALAQIGPWARTNPGLPAATETQPGIGELATVAEATTGTDKSRLITPFTLNEVVRKPHATESAYGTTKYATTAEAMDASNKVTSICPSALDDVFKTRQATEVIIGTSKVATIAQAEAGADDNVMMTPKKVKAAINKFVLPIAPATESNQGVVKLATAAEIANGVARDGVAISPYGFANARGTDSAYGTFKCAQDADYINFTAQDKAVTPHGLGRNKGAPGRYGIVALATAPDGTANTAIASTAPVIFKNVANQVLSQHLYVGDTNHGNKLATINEANSAVPVGATMLWFTDNIPVGFIHLAGQWLNRHSYPGLFAILGYMYGGDGGDNFAIPDMRGMFPRGTDHGRGTDPGRGTGSLQRCGVEYHKHYSGWGEHTGAHGSYFGCNPNRGYGGSAKTDWDNNLFFTNNGQPEFGYDQNSDRPGVMANETRPWNVACNFIIKLG